MSDSMFGWRAGYHYAGKQDVVGDHLKSEAQRLASEITDDLGGDNSAKRGSVFREIVASEFTGIVQDALSQIYDRASVEVSVRPDDKKLTGSVIVDIAIKAWAYSPNGMNIHWTLATQPHAVAHVQVIWVASWHMALGWPSKTLLTEWMAMVAIAWFNQAYCEQPNVRQYHEKVLDGRYL